MDDKTRPDHGDMRSPELNQPALSPSELLPPPTKLTTLASPIAGRLDTALRSMYALSHKAARRLITTHKVSVDGVSMDRWEAPVLQGSLITIHPSAPNLSKKRALGAQLIFQDDALVVISKPAGLLSAPQRDSDEPSALQAASRLCRGPRRPRVVHRLDKDTSGLLLFARTIPATRALQALLQERNIKRVYRCIVRGEVREDRGYLSSWLLRDAGKGKRGSRTRTFKYSPPHKQPAPEENSKPALSQSSSRPRPQGQWALTYFQVVSRQQGFTALEVELFTGRTHQIRIHLAELGHPLLGEWVYGPRVKREPRLALHAARLEFTHPFSHEPLSFEAPWPDELRTHSGVPQSWLDIGGSQPHNSLGSNQTKDQSRQTQTRSAQVKTTRRSHTDSASKANSQRSRSTRPSRKSRRPKR